MRVCTCVCTFHVYIHVYLHIYIHVYIYTCMSIPISILVELGSMTPHPPLSRLLVMSESRPSNVLKEPTEGLKGPHSPQQAASSP